MHTSTGAFVRDSHFIRVRQVFHAVGHGTFFAGIAWRLDGCGTVFRWVYDCGSKRTKRIATAIGALPHGFEQIDLLVISHFDDDHINGIEELIRTRRVRRLALPYLDFPQRLAQAASIEGEVTSCSTALFQLDPLGWLERKGLSDRVDSILFVEGGLDDDNDPQPDAGAPQLPNPRQLGGGQNETALASISRGEQMFLEMRLTGAQAVPSKKAMAWPHKTPLHDKDDRIEFMFFNSEQPNLFRFAQDGTRCAKRSGATVGQLQLEVQAIVQKYRMLDASGPPRRKWRDALQSCYMRHFGASSQDRNNISLCLLVSPRKSTPRKSCISETQYPSGRETRRVCLGERAGLLCLGDLRIDASTINAMKAHFGQKRWDSMAVIQVPHHGSKNSWVDGNAKALNPDCFVHCVPDISNHHPHPGVQSDLVGYPDLTAKYWTGVGFDYCLSIYPT